jgi:hypothetical protein
MGKSNYTLTTEQKAALDIIAEKMIEELENRLGAVVGDILDPYNGRKLDINKLTAMMWYVGDQIASY